MSRKKENRWIPTFYDHSPMFEDCRRLIKNNQCPKWPDWPDCKELNYLWPTDNMTLSGLKTHFIEQDSINFAGRYYEEYIYESGGIPTRDGNWHDFFNAMIWLQFPKTKAVINALHVEEMTRQKEYQREGVKDSQKRTRKRDALTLFDESGVIFVSSKKKNSDALKGHQWKELFYANRKDWYRSMTVFIFGHGLYEKVLAPYIGMTGNALIHSVSDNFFQLNRKEQIADVDKSLTEKMLTEELLREPSCLSPLPLLGVPGWWPENKNETFYENKKYFRPLKNKF